MRHRRDDASEHEDHAGHGFSGFLRSLIPGVPWCERAEVEETVEIAAPHSGVLRVHNSNGRTRIVGEEREDIFISAHKLARAESETAAKELLDDIRLAFSETPEALDLEVEVSRKWNRRGYANLCVRLPREMDVWVAAANGRVSEIGRASCRERV